MSLCVMSMKHLYALATVRLSNPNRCFFLYLEHTINRCAEHFSNEYWKMTECFKQIMLWHHFVAIFRFHSFKIVSVFASIFEPPKWQTKNHFIYSRYLFGDVGI